MADQQDDTAALALVLADVPRERRTDALALLCKLHIERPDYVDLLAAQANRAPAGPPAAEQDGMLPCPFCGHEGVLGATNAWCSVCGASTAPGLTSDGARQVWNTRAPAEPAPPAGAPTCHGTMTGPFVGETCTTAPAAPPMVPDAGGLWYRFHAVQNVVFVAEVQIDMDDGTPRWRWWCPHMCSVDVHPFADVRDDGLWCGLVVSAHDRFLLGQGARERIGGQYGR